MKYGLFLKSSGNVGNLVHNIDAVLPNKSENGINNDLM